ncbi:MAG: transporter associated domain-containing protein [Gammaproteobacteria bacterium]
MAEVSEFLESARQSNVIDKEAQIMANKALRLGDTSVKEIMVPKVEMITVDIDEPASSFIERIIQSGHSRYPVLGKTMDEVSGILLAKDLLPLLSVGQTEFNIEDMLRKANVVPETKKADSLLEEFKKDRSHLAIVVDEYGAISGLVTIEDILEELVGEIEDEHDNEEEELIQISENEYIADGKLDIETFEDHFEVDVGDQDVETIGGLMINKLGVLPKIDDEIMLGNMKLKVAIADKRKIKKIGISILPE